MIAPNMLQRFSLRVANGTHALVALDDCAYYEPQAIPDDRAFRGHGFLKGYGPVLVRTWTMDDNAVRELPPAAATDTTTPAFGASPEEKVRAFLVANPGATQRAAAEATGVSLGKVNAIIKGL
jgi:S-DNA-T family DNA segregation ATPase FtsK/SpoIIIE